jgi:hypothetical protein
VLTPVEGTNMPNQETVNDEAKLIIHRWIARRLGSDAGMVDRARVRLAEIERESGQIDYVDMWKDILSKDPLTIRRHLVARDETSCWLRISSPFSTVSGLPLNDVPLRRRIWRDARRLVMTREQRHRELSDGLDTERKPGRGTGGFRPCGMRRD